MKVLVVGSGGREHALVHKISLSPRVEKIFCAPGNGGISSLATCVPISATDISGMVDWALKNEMSLVVVAPDDPLAMGMVDALEAAGLKAFGPSRLAAQIEASKAFSKGLMKKYGIPTAQYEVFDQAEEAKRYLAHAPCPVVIKADGLALGKGVIIAKTREEALKAVTDIMEDKVFSSAGNRIVVEEFLTGREVTVLAFSDGVTLIPMVSSQDHKRALDGDQGLNTGGMGAISPSPYYTATVEKQCMERIFLPTIAALKQEGRPFKGVIYFGLMLTDSGPKVIEYNARLGDPEAQVVLPRLKNDLVEILLAIVEERLHTVDIQWREEATACVVLASGGYPEKYEKGYSICGIGEADACEGVKVYHAGTRLSSDQVVTAGGRVLGVTALGETLEEALRRAYAGVSKIQFKDMHFRRDIGMV